MNILDKYIIRAHIAPFLFGFFVVVFVFLMQFVFKYIDQLLGKGLDAFVIIQLIVLNIAWMAVLGVPIGVMFATLLAFGSLSATSEITVIKASGGSLIRMMAPIAVIGAGLTAFLFWFNDQILPDANHQAKILLGDIQRKKPTFSLVSGQFSSEIEGVTILPRKVDSATGILTGVTIYDQRRPQVLNIANADTGIVKFNEDYSKLTMTLYHGELHQIFRGDSRDYRLVKFEEYKVYLPASGFSFVRSTTDMSSRGDREMKINDMQKIVDQAMGSSYNARKTVERELNKNLAYVYGQKPLEDEYSRTRLIRGKRDSLAAPGDRISSLKRVQERLNFLKSSISTEASQEKRFYEEARQYEVEIYKKYAIPFACLIFVFVGAPLGIITRGGNYGVSAAITLGFYIFYWACLIGGEKFADRGMMSPFMSMWMGNIICGFVGILLTIKVNNESMKILPSWLTKLFKKKHI